MFSFLARLGRIQRSSGYKKFASVVVVLVIAGLIATLAIIANRPDAEVHAVAEVSTPNGFIELGPIGAVKGGIDAMVVQLTTRDGVVSASIAGAFIAAVAIAIVWLGLSLTYLGALLIGWAVAWPLMVFGGTRDYGLMLFGIVPLVLSLLTLLQLARIALSAPTPTLAIAKNVLSEAVRMKISLVFIVILLLLLAVTPNALTADQALRYRVAQWLTYGLGLSFVVLALLTVFFSVGTVTFEQRDKIIWQTMTKPVRAHEYLIGKWLGVMTLNLILLTVSAAGVFLFTEYLRYQPADGERAYMVDTQGNRTRVGSEFSPSEDRRILENQVLAARVSLEPIPYDLSDRALDFFTDLSIINDENLDDSDRSEVRQNFIDSYQATVQSTVDSRLNNLRGQADYFEGGERGIGFRAEQITESVLEELAASARSIPPGRFRDFHFDLRKQWNKFQATYDRSKELITVEVDRQVEAGAFEKNDARAIDDARYRALLDLQSQGKIPEFPMFTVRFTIDAGANDPTAIYDLSFFLNGELYPRPLDQPIETWGTKSVGLGHATSFDFPLNVLDNQVDDQLDGILVMRVISSPSNPRTLTFSKGNMEIMYDAGGYQLNFLRTIATMWMKLAFIASVGIALSTFLSFPVAALVTLAVLFAAEGADYLTESLENYSAIDKDQHKDYIRLVIRVVSLGVAWVFDTYASLKPAEGIADGRLMKWSTLANAAVWIVGWSLTMLSLGWAAFRRRELATYSGH